jgi:hypothetical protein
MPNKSKITKIDKNKFIHFDYEFYKRTYTDLEDNNITTKEQCMTHYLLCGIKEERSCCEGEMTTKYQNNMQKALEKIENFHDTKGKKNKHIDSNQQSSRMFQKMH